jgi:hypothetical protein
LQWLNFEYSVSAGKDRFSLNSRVRKRGSYLRRAVVDTWAAVASVIGIVFTGEKLETFPVELFLSRERNP